jgi:hypothetical protein
MLVQRLKKGYLEKKRMEGNIMIKERDNEERESPPRD